MQITPDSNSLIWCSGLVRTDPVSRTDRSKAEQHGLTARGAADNLTGYCSTNGSGSPLRLTAASKVAEDTSRPNRPVTTSRFNSSAHRGSSPRALNNQRQSNARPCARRSNREHDPAASSPGGIEHQNEPDAEGDPGSAQHPHRCALAGVSGVAPVSL